MTSQWQTGVAEVISSQGRTITVRCPHCPETHNHGKDVVGSKSVVAGCHNGANLVREYAIVDTRRKRR